MKSKKTEKNTLLKVAHKMAQGLKKAKLIDADEMKEFDALCLPQSAKKEQKKAIKKS